MLKPGKTYDEIYDSFEWKIPDLFNMGVDVCDKWAHQRYRLALIYQDEKGQLEKVYILGFEKALKTVWPTGSKRMALNRGIGWGSYCLSRPRRVLPISPFIKWGRW